MESTFDRAASLIDVGDNDDDVLIGDSSPLESDNTGTNFAGPSNNDLALNAVLANWLSSNPFLAPVAVIQSSGIKGTVADGSADVLRGSQLNNNYFQNRDNAEILRNTTTDDVVDVS